jgi:regulator of replication initiation timing
MPELKLKQLQYESDTWKRLLSFMIEENVRLKNRLSEILKEQFNHNLLEEVEGFQNRFLKEDELIGLLRNEIVEFDKLLVREAFEDGKIIRVVGKKMEKLRSNIETAEKQFGKLKSEFNSYLTEKI